MTARTASLFAALSLGAFASSALAEEPGTILAWGHEFRGAAVSAGAAVHPAPRSHDVLSRNPAAMPRTYTSTETGGALRPSAERSARTINAWGARFDMPTR